MPPADSLLASSPARLLACSACLDPSSPANLPVPPATPACMKAPSPFSRSSDPLDPLIVSAGIHGALTGRYSTVVSADLGRMSAIPGADKATDPCTKCRPGRCHFVVPFVAPDPAVWLSRFEVTAAAAAAVRVQHVPRPPPYVRCLLVTSWAHAASAAPR